MVKTDIRQNPSSATHELEWHACCSRSSPQFIIFIASFVISFLSIVFCMVMLFYTRHDCSAQQVYTGIFVFLVGVWLPQASSNASNLTITGNNLSTPKQSRQRRRLYPQRASYKSCAKHSKSKDDKEKEEEEQEAIL